MTRAGSGFSGSFVSGFPTARLGFTLRRGLGHEATEHLSTKGTWVPPFLGLVCLSIHADHLEDDRGAGWGPAREGALTLDKVTSVAIIDPAFGIYLESIGQSRFRRRIIVRL